MDSLETRVHFIYYMVNTSAYCLTNIVVAGGEAVCLDANWPSVPTGQVNIIRITVFWRKITIH